MVRVLFDGNVYNKLELHPAIIDRIKFLIAEGRLTILCNQVVEDELLLSPYNGIPGWFSVQKISEPGSYIGRAMIAPDGADANDERYAKIVPDVSAYSQHRGSSNKSRDAIIADTASRKCDYLVSEDQRLVRRMNEHVGSMCKGIAFVGFCELIRE